MGCEQVALEPLTIILLLAKPNTSVTFRSSLDLDMAVPYAVDASLFEPFSPIRSEPPASLMQDIPPGVKSAHCLLLGCGDPGTILFTLFGEEGIGKAVRGYKTYSRV